jgi:cytochrome c biogenesis protein CcmG/thiol:disulfide interchange protein DsbE
MQRVLSPVPIAIVGVLVALLAQLARGELERAPELELPKLGGGGNGSLADYRGEVVVLNFWASWCEPCKAESPLLERWHRRMVKQGGTVLGVDMLDLTSRAEEFIDDYGLTYPMLKDREGDGMELFGVIAYPETFLIDREGRIAAAERGPVDEEWMQTNVVPLLERS